MTAKNPTHAEPATSKEAVSRDRFFRETRTGGFESTRRTEEGVDYRTIEPEKPPNDSSRELIFRSPLFTRGNPLIPVHRYRGMNRILLHREMRMHLHSPQRPLLPSSNAAGLQPKQIRESLIQLVQGQRRTGSPGDHDEIHVRSKIPSLRPKPSPKPPLEAIANHRVPDLPTRRDPQTTAGRSRLRR